jgi:energy-coupling factor transporter ATP-binding protein EcfA2
MKALMKRLFLPKVQTKANGDVIFRWGEDDLKWQHLLSGGLLLIGMTGSGKSSTFALLARQMLESSEGCSFLVLTSKPSDIGDWKRLWKSLKREVDFVHVHPGSHRINLLHYELTRPGGTVQSAAQFFKLLSDIASLSNGQDHESAFWGNLFTVLIQAAFSVARLAKDIPTFDDVYKIVLSIPQTREQAVSDTWTRQSECGKMMSLAAKRIKTSSEEREFRRCMEVILHELPAVGEKARGAAISMVNGILSKFLAEPWNEMLSCETSNLLPDDLFTGERGKIVVLDFPVLVWGDPGRFFQTLFCMLAQAACLRRSVIEHPRIVVIARDEVQLYCHGAWDAKVLGVARSAKLIHCSLFQTISTLIGTGFGGSEAARYHALAFIAGHSNILSYANICSDTNSHIAELLGKSRKLFFGGSSGAKTPTGNFFDDLLGVGAAPQVNWNEQLDYLCSPSEFLKLRTGGVNHAGLVDAIWFQGGRRFANGKPFRHVTFQQEFQS